MKYQLLLLLSCLTFFGCKNDKQNSNSSDKKSISVKKTDKDIIFICDNFFDKGDYSTICFTSSKTPVNKLDESPIPSICIYRVGKQQNSNDDYVSVNFQNLGSSTVSFEVFKELKQELDGTVTNINNLGEDAYVNTYLTQDIFKEKDLVVLYKNFIISFHVIYEKTNPQPCSYDNSELKNFAAIVIQNL